MRVEKSIRRDPHEALPDDSGGSWPQKSVIRRNWAMEKLETAIKERYPDELLDHFGFADDLGPISQVTRIGDLQNLRKPPELMQGDLLQVLRVVTSLVLRKRMPRSGPARRGFLNQLDFGTGARRSPDRAEKRSGYDPAKPAKAHTTTFCTF
jgi:hypothetical protein